jgi:arginyl-tRNA synthetase
MNSVVAQIKAATVTSIQQLYGVELTIEQVLVNATKPEFEGDYTVVLFAFVKQLKKSPDALGQELGTALVADHPALFSGFNVIKGFLNLSISNAYWLGFLQSVKGQDQVLVYTLHATKP